MRGLVSDATLGALTRLAGAQPTFSTFISPSIQSFANWQVPPVGLLGPGLSAFKAIPGLTFDVPSIDLGFASAVGTGFQLTSLLNGIAERGPATLSSTFPANMSQLIESINSSDALGASVTSLMQSAKLGSFGFDYSNFRRQLVRVEKTLSEIPQTAEELDSVSELVIAESERSAFSIDFFQASLGLATNSKAAGQAVALTLALTAGGVAYLVDAGVNGDFSPVSSVVIASGVYLGVRKLWERS